MAFKRQHLEEHARQLNTSKEVYKEEYILTKSWTGHSYCTHIIIYFIRLTSNIAHGKPQIIQIHSLLPQ